MTPKLPNDVVHLEEGYVRMYRWRLVRGDGSPMSKTRYPSLDFLQIHRESLAELHRRRVTDGADNLTAEILRDDLRIPCRGSIIKAAILYIVVESLARTRGIEQCSGCIREHPGQRAHMGHHGCLESDTHLAERIPTKVEASTIATMYSNVLKKLGLPPDGFALMAAIFALEVYTDFYHDVADRDTHYDRLFALYTS